MDEKRKTPRRRVLKDGKIEFLDFKCLLDCAIREVPTSVGVPDAFQLYEKSSGLLYRASIVWRKANAIGVQFEGPVTSIHDAANKRMRPKLL